MKLFISIASLVLLSFSTPTGIYAIHFKSINGNVVHMSIYSGKKILIFVLPVTQNPSDSNMLRSLDSLSKRYSNLAVVAIPSFDDGYNPANSASLSSFYTGLLGTSVTIAAGMYTKKGAAMSQHELFSWLTHSTKNEHYNYDSQGPGQKFFINEEGVMYAVVNPGLPLWSRHIQNLVQQ